jgi:hypothetical protein
MVSVKCFVSCVFCQCSFHCFVKPTHLLPLPFWITLNFLVLMYVNSCAHNASLYSGCTTFESACFSGSVEDYSLLPLTTLGIFVCAYTGFDMRMCTRRLLVRDLSSEFPLDVALTSSHVAHERYQRLHIDILTALHPVLCTFMPYIDQYHPDSKSFEFDPFRMRLLWISIKLSPFPRRNCI